MKRGQPTPTGVLNYSLNCFSFCVMLQKNLQHTERRRKAVRQHVCLNWTLPFLIEKNIFFFLCVCVCVVLCTKKKCGKRFLFQKNFVFFFLPREKKQDPAYLVITILQYVFYFTLRKWRNKDKKQIPPCRREMVQGTEKGF